MECASNKSENPIPGSWEETDIRVSKGFMNTSVINELIQFGVFENIISNIHATASGKLVALRLSTRFEDDEKKREEGWISIPTPVNKDLAAYLTLFGVEP